MKTRRHLLDQIIKKNKIVITVRKRGKFKTTLADGTTADFPNKKEAVQWLWIKLRLMPTNIFKVEKIGTKEVKPAVPEFCQVIVPTHRAPYNAKCGHVLPCPFHVGDGK
jgi:hypothetical protein